MELLEKFQVDLLERSPVGGFFTPGGTLGGAPEKLPDGNPREIPHKFFAEILGGTPRGVLVWTTVEISERNFKKMSLLMVSLSEFQE